MSTVEASTYSKGFHKRLYDPEASLHSSDGFLDPLIRKQNAFLEENLEPSNRSWICSNTVKCIIIVFLIPVAIILAVVVFNDLKHSNGQCYAEFSCSTSSFYDLNTGFTNDTGWASPSSDACCEICSVPHTPNKICFNTTPGSNCMSKTGTAGDYDFVMLDQMWLPQFCHALDAGYDPTLSHLAGSKCNNENSLPNQLIIHGLWPNYYDGFPQCCNSSLVGLTPLVPSQVVKWSIWPELQAVWYDPTKTPPSSDNENTNECNICYILNHEWVKHGKLTMLLYTLSIILILYYSVVCNYVGWI